MVDVKGRVPEAVSQGERRKYAGSTNCIAPASYQERRGSQIVVTNNEQRFLVAEQLRPVDIAPASIVLESVRRNTAPALAVAPLAAMRESAEPILLVLPFDHVITGETAFVEAAEAAAEIAKDGYLVAFGIASVAPHFGYGYIRAGV